MRLKRLFIKLAKKFLNRPDLNFNESIPWSMYIKIAWQRFRMLVRGTIRGVFFKSHGKRLYIGKHVQISCSNMITAGSGVSIQDCVVLQALSQEGMILGNNCSVGQRTAIKISGSLIEIGKGFRLGNYSSIANDCFIGAAGGVSIGDYVAIGQNVRFHSENHNFADATKLISEQGTTHEGIQIGDDCWIGAGAVFLDGSSLGKGCVVGANALVTKKFPDYCVIGGVPARIISMRR